MTPRLPRVFASHSPPVLLQVRAVLDRAGPMMRKYGYGFDEVPRQTSFLFPPPSHLAISPMAKAQGCLEPLKEARTWRFGENEEWMMLNPEGHKELRSRKDTHPSAAHSALSLGVFGPRT